MSDPVGLALYLAAEQSVLRLIENLPDKFYALHGLRPVIRKHGYVNLRRRRPGVGLGIRRVIAEKAVLDQDRAGIDPKAIDPAVEPETHGVGHCFADVSVAPIQIRLARQKRMVVELPRGFAPLPCAAAKPAKPIVRRPAVRAGLLPNVPVGLGIVAGRAAFLEPGVLVGRVVRNEIENEPDVGIVQGIPEAFEVVHRAITGINGAEVRDVVTEILIGTLIDWRQPNGAYPEPFDIVD